MKLTAIFLCCVSLFGGTPPPLDGGLGGPTGLAGSSRLCGCGGADRFGVHAQLVAQDLAADLFDLAGFELAQLERAIRRADQPVHGQADVDHGAANLAVLAFAQADGQPCVCALLAVQRDLHRLKALAIDLDAIAQRGQHLIGGAAVDAHAVFAQPAGRRQFQLALDRAVIGQQKQSLGIEVKAADAHDARQILGQVVIDCRAALFVAGGGHQARGLVIQPQPRGIGGGQRDVVDGDLVGVGDVQRGAVDLRAVHGDAPLGDHAFGLASAGAACAGDDLGDSVSGRGLFSIRVP